MGNLVTCLKLIDGTFVLGYTSKLEHYESKDWKEDKKVVKLGNKYNDIKKFFAVAVNA